MRIGDLRHRVTIRQKQITHDSNGYPQETWENAATVWAAVEPLSGREYFQAAAVQAEQPVRFTIRYRSDITAEMRLRYEGKDYDIKAVIDLKGQHRWLQIMGEVVESG